MRGFDSHFQLFFSIVPIYRLMINVFVIYYFSYRVFQRNIQFLAKKYIKIKNRDVYEVLKE